MSDHNKLLMTVSEVSEALSVGASSIWRKVGRDEFPKPIKIGGSTRWHRSEVEQYIADLTATQREDRA